MFRKVLIANRGEIAVRVIRACRHLGITTVAVYSPADAHAMHTQLADEAYPLPGNTAAESYLNVDALMKAVIESDAEAVHPGYGFLSESTELAAALTAQGRVFIGPGTHALDVMGNKISARAAAIEAGVPVVPGLTAGVETPAEIKAFADEFGYPIAIKASYGGGGRGLKVVERAEQIAPALESARREAAAYFGNADVYLERYLKRPKHIEVQILADAHGTVLWLGERDCSVQRRHQKLIEESPARSLTEDLRRRMGEAAVAVARHIGYVNAGTVEFLVENGEFYFLEMNTRLQVEHPVTEMVTGIDLVEAQLRVAAGEPIGLTRDDITCTGHAIELRIGAEDPAGGRFLPAPGRIETLDFPAGFGVRVDAGYRSGDTVSEFYDGLVAKVICWGADRASAIARATGVLREIQAVGVPTTATAHREILEAADFQADRHHTRWLGEDFVLSSPAPVAVPESADEPESIPDRSVVRVGGRDYWIPRAIPQAPGTAVVAPQTVPNLGARLAASSGPAGVDGTVVSPMQGTVIKVTLEVGAQVSAGELICVLEAMKMENPITAGRAGTLERLEVRPGSTVSAGTLLAVIA
ncbi:acetyl/propionyl/methylcrotonyl-CoA carboxylase subunit alpha [Nocardia huaxiensis]|uniref:acetyl/propionyl/methylcrotonyl-CoA carboxylase subunit alpha n=1 Tax=Nocardia huaxiensis TaxID=2755382 RepID=UPI001E4ADEDE|nr:biotin carboxylase N-terminal domain-containing protein [Nocardia huaxiensis]UFS98527.1 ATP-grasp domain-containing protein [Nocardia huaxiensis]